MQHEMVLIRKNHEQSDTPLTDALWEITYRDALCGGRHD